MKILGQWKPEKEKVDKRRYVADCTNPNCRCVVEFSRYEVDEIVEKGTSYRNEFNKVCVSADKSYWGIVCPNCHRNIFVCDYLDELVFSLKDKRERKKAVEEYYKTHDTGLEYD